eukprot:119714_1
MEEKKSGLGDNESINGLSSPTSPSHSHNNSIDSNAYQIIISNLKKLKIREPIILNIGGIKYHTSITTLLKHEDCIFNKMFSGKFLIDRDGSHFIDRDGTHFMTILNYLRTGHLFIDLTNDILKKQILLEAQYYQIQPLINILNPKIDSVILCNDNDYLYKVLESWMSMELLRQNTKITNNKNKKIVDFPKLYFKLIFRASKHGFSSATFHRLCDHKQNTVCVIHANDTIFGGYTRIPWEANYTGRAVDQINSNTKSNNSFSFFLKSNSDVWKKKYNLYKPEKWNYYGSNKTSYVKNPCYSVYHHSQYGPVFGYRPCFEYNGDLCGHIIVGDKCNEKFNSRIDSFVGESLSVRKHMTDSFFVYDYEIFQICQL